jgi:hypothetical protein
MPNFYTILITQRVACRIPPPPRGEFHKLCWSYNAKDAFCPPSTILSIGGVESGCFAPTRSLFRDNIHLLVIFYYITSLLDFKEFISAADNSSRFTLRSENAGPIIFKSNINLSEIIITILKTVSKFNITNPSIPKCPLFK